MVCPGCSSENTIKNGTIHNGKQKYECKECGRQFVEHLQNKIISQATKELIDKLLLEKVPLAGIARVTDVSGCWLQNTDFLQQCKSSIKHSIIGTIYYTLWASFSINQTFCIIKSILSLFQSIFNQDFYLILFHTASPSFSTA